VSLALRDPDGLLAVGGDLGSARLLAAYRRGIFPWYSEGQPVLWWAPDPRTVLFPALLKVSRSLRRTLNRQHFVLSMDRAFDAVVAGCAEPREDGGGTWITAAMAAAYSRLHREGHAHSVECWRDDRLVGGLYGVAIGRAFFGESMFSRATDASKVAFCHLVRQISAWGFGLVDCQVHSAHLASLGARQIPRSRFVEHLDIWCEQPQDNEWRFDAGLLTERWS
jgi:leucyl/phenylalanyl-tRNA--protein transferase